MEAFQAPPAAVMPPVTQDAKTAGMIRVLHRCQRPRRKLAAASRRSLGIAEAPAMTLNRMYHWAPRLISRIPPKFRLIPVLIRARVANGNRKLAGKLASTWTTGWAYRVTLGFIPIQTPA